MKPGFRILFEDGRYYRSVRTTTDDPDKALLFHSRHRALKEVEYNPAITQPVTVVGTPIITDRERAQLAANAKAKAKRDADRPVYTVDILGIRRRVGGRRHWS